MRPRVFPAEDRWATRCNPRSPGRFNEAAGIPRGRRRCKRKTKAFEASFNEAAGIPRGRLELAIGQRGEHPLASMRPRVFPAEDVVDRQVAQLVIHASMRPRVFPAEDGAGGRAGDRLPDRFNEAAGIPRGRPSLRRFPVEWHRRFNEAAGIPRGRLIHRGRPVRGLHASMRPRVFPAEDVAGDAGRDGRDGASMRPRVFPAEDARAVGASRCFSGRLQ